MSRSASSSSRPSMPARSSCRRDAPHIPGDEAGHNSRAASLSTSTDFANWTAPEMRFFADERDQEIGRLAIEETLADPTRRQPEFNVPETYNAQVYNLSVFRYEGLYVGLAMMFLPQRTRTQRVARFRRNGLAGTDPCDRSTRG